MTLEIVDFTNNETLTQKERDDLDHTIFEALSMVGEDVMNTTPITMEICNQFAVQSLFDIPRTRLAEVHVWILLVWTHERLEWQMKGIHDHATDLMRELQQVHSLICRQQTIFAKRFAQLVGMVLLLVMFVPSATAQSEPPRVATSQIVDLTNLPEQAQPITFDNLNALQAEMTGRGISTFYSSAATRAEFEPVERIGTDCLNGRTPSDAGKKLVADAIDAITPKILSLGGTLYPDVNAYFGEAFTADCVMKFDSYTQALLSSYGSPAMLVQIDPALQGGVATMIFYKATGEAQFLFYSLESQFITNNLMRLDHPAVQRQSVINDAVRVALLCFEYKPESTSRKEGNRNCPFCALCQICFNDVVGDANKKYNLLKSGIEAGVLYGAVEKCAPLKTYLYRAGCLIGVLWGRKIALNTIAEDYNQSVREKLEQCKKDIAEKTKDLPGGVVRCEYRETPQ